MNELLAISPIDGRYYKQVSRLSDFFSEAALIKYRVKVEIEYFIALAQTIPQLSHLSENDFKNIRAIVDDFGSKDVTDIKNIEKTINHDVKAVEYFIKERFIKLGLNTSREFIHFGLTSQDVNNTAIPLSIKEFNEQVYFPKIQELIEKLKSLSDEWRSVPMLARTHGQPASPTTVGKEFFVFVERLILQFETLKSIPYAAKFGGATGNLNAHYAAYPNINWVDFANHFVNNILGLYRSQTTTQIEHYDFTAAYFDNVKRLNNIMIDLDRDVWSYISIDFFKQKTIAGEVGSSAMPHKVNPIDFENSEGNLGISNAMCEFFASKLPISRWQRDLTDSTVLRNIGVPLAHSIIAIKSTLKGLEKLLLNEETILKDLDNNWAVLAEAIQTILRREAYPQPYEKLKELTRGKDGINAKSIAEFVQGLEVSEDVKQEILRFTPFNYIGNAQRF